MKYLALILLISFPAFAEPVASARAGDITVILYNEPCNLPAVSNLPGRATWHEGGKVFEGCFGVASWAPVVMLFFGNDKTVVSYPAQAFKPVTNI